MVVQWEHEWEEEEEGEEEKSTPAWTPPPTQYLICHFLSFSPQSYKIGVAIPIIQARKQALR